MCISRRNLMLSAVAASGLVAPAIAKPVTLTYWTPLDPKSDNPRSRGETAMIDVFRKKYPDVTVNIQPVPWQVIGQQVMQAILGGGGPDVVQLSTTNLPDHVAAGTLKPLDDLVGKGWSEAERNDFILPWDNTIYDGRKVAFYWNTILTNQLWYLGDEINGKPPMDWYKFAEFLVPQSAKANKPGFLTGLSKTGTAAQLMEWLIPAFWACNAEFMTPDGKPGFINVQGQQPFQWLMALIEKYKVTPESITSLTRDNVLDGLQGRRALTTVMGSNVLSTARDILGPNLMLAEQPGPNGPCPAFGNGKFLAVTRDASQPEVAGHFIEEMSSVEAQLANAKLAGEIPARKSVLKDGWFKTPEAGDLRWSLEYLAAHPHQFKYQKGNQYLAMQLAVAAQRIVAGEAIDKALQTVGSRWEQQQD